jgi:hypothetical protein
MEVRIYSFDNVSGSSKILRAVRLHTAETGNEFGTESITFTASDIQDSNTDLIQIILYARGIVSGNIKAIWTVQVSAGDPYILHNTATQSYAPATDAGEGVLVDFLVWDTV